MSKDERRPNEAPSGNASNPAPQQEIETGTPVQLIDPKGEKYVRESGNIEDLPDPEEESSNGS